MKQRILASALAACACLSAGRAFAADPSVAVNPAPRATCVNERELVEALARARVTASVAPRADVTVTIDGTPNALSVTVLRNSVDATELLPPATCETATDAVAAFLASALAPAVAPAAPSASPSPVAAAHPPAATPANTAPNPWAEPERGLALRDALERVPGRRVPWVLPSLEILMGSAYVTLGGFDASSKHVSGANAALEITGGGLEVLGGIGALAAGRDYNGDIVLTSFLAGEGFILAGSRVYDSTLANRATAGGFIAGAVLASFNLYRHRPLRRLREARATLSRQPLTRARAAEIERDLAQADPLIPYWLVATPVATGFAVATAPTLVDPKTHAGDFVFAIGGLTTLGAVILVDAASGSIWGSYERALKRVGIETLSLGPGPGPLGLSLAGTF